MEYLSQFRVVTVGEPTPAYLEKLQDPESVFEYWKKEIAPTLDLSKENLIVITLKSNSVPSGWHHAGLGSVNQALAEPIDIFRPVIAANAPYFVVMHNHPSGDPTPSQADRTMTQRTRQGAEILRLGFYDHVIAGDITCFSFRSCGLL